MEVGWKKEEGEGRRVWVDDKEKVPALSAKAAKRMGTVKTQWLETAQAKQPRKRNQKQSRRYRAALQVERV
jgi:hypothetical protein